MTNPGPNPQPGPHNYSQGYGGGAVPPGPPVKQPKQKKSLFKRPWFWAAVVVIIIIIAVSANSGGSKNKDTGTSAPVTSGAVVAPSTASAAASSANKSSASKSTGISQGLGTKDASADVKVGKLAYAEDSGTQLTLTVTNHSSKRSDYIIDVALETASGSQQLDDSPALAENLDPGQSTKVKVDFLNYIDKAPPSAAVVKLKSIQRNPSL